MFEVSLNKFEKHDLVIRLMEEGKTYREICHIAHVSPRDIKKINQANEKKVRLQNKNETQEGNIQTKTATKKESLSTQAFKLFREGKEPTEVAIELNIPFKNAKKFWFQFLNLERMEECYELYKVFRYEIPNLLSIANFMNRNNISGNNIVNVLRTANDVINLNQYYSNLKAEIEKLEQIKKDYSFQILPPLQPLPRYPSSWNGYYY